MSNKSFYRVSAIVTLVVVGLVAIFLIWRQRTNQPALISQEQAIQNAIPACEGIGLQPVEQPTEIEAKLVFGGAEIPPNDSDPTRPVWVVTMKGRWLLVGGPRSAPDPNNPTPQPSYDTECIIKIDAQTGVSVSAVIE